MVKSKMLLMAVTLGLCVAAIDATAQNKPELLDRMHRIAAGTSLDSANTKPWHLKMTIQLYDDKGALSETGTVEEWWKAPGREKRVYTFPSFKDTYARTEKGFYRSPDGGSPPYIVDFVLSQFVHPMPSDEEIDEAKLDMRKETMGKNEFDCVMLTHPIPRVAYPPFGLFPTYCMDHDKDTLRITADFGSQVTIMNKLGVLRGVSVPLQMDISSNNKTLAIGHVEALQSRETAFPDTAVTDGLELHSGTNARIEGGIMAGMIIKKVQPIYPQAAKDRHADGTVRMHAIIGRDGHVHSLKPLTYPDPDLVISAIAAVRQWTYKPYLLNGEPTEVDTTITVNYALSR